MQNFIERHRSKIEGVTSCFDRLVLTGTIPGICYAEGMAGHLHSHNIRIFDYPQWATPLREEIRQNAEKIANDSGLEIEFVRKQKNFRKEQRVKEVVEQRGGHLGQELVRTAVHAVKADNIATFLGRKLNGNYQGEMGKPPTKPLVCSNACEHTV